MNCRCVLATEKSESGLCGVVGEYVVYSFFDKLWWKGQVGAFQRVNR